MFFTICCVIKLLTKENEVYKNVDDGRQEKNIENFNSNLLFLTYLSTLSSCAYVKLIQYEYATSKLMTLIFTIFKRLKIF